MSAGTGVSHSEHNYEPLNTRLYQIWIKPNKINVEPRWERKQFPKEKVDNKLALLASGMPEHQGLEVAFIHADAAIYGGNLKKGATVHHKIKHQAYILASEGEFTINGKQMNRGDGAEITNLDVVTVKAKKGAEILIIDVSK
jgi:redox-sensitive bicupin YhaK (pirin superfamily)